MNIIEIIKSKICKFYDYISSIYDCNDIPQYKNNFEGLIIDIKNINNDMAKVIKELESNKKLEQELENRIMDCLVEFLNSKNDKDINTKIKKKITDVLNTYSEAQVQTKEIKCQTTNDNLINIDVCFNIKNKINNHIIFTI